MRTKGTAGVRGVASAHQAIATLRILPDYRCHLAASTSLADLARAHNLEVYDAAYLELALRLQLPLATIDRKLKDAAKAVKVFYDP